MKTPYLTLLVAIQVFACDAFAQLVSNPVLGGKPVYCTLPNGLPVFSTTAVMSDWAKVGTAPYPGPPGYVAVIYLNPKVLPNLPPPVQWFVYGHECMHHRLGHTFGNIKPSMEIDADCSAVKLLRDQGLLNQQTTQLVASYFQNNPPAPPFYPPGPQRAARILACYNTP